MASARHLGWLQYSAVVVVCAFADSSRAQKVRTLLPLGCRVRSFALEPVAFEAHTTGIQPPALRVYRCLSSRLFARLRACAPTPDARQRALASHHLFHPTHSHTRTIRAQVEWVQTARFKDGSVKLLEDMPPLEMVPMGSAPKSLAVDTSRRHQEIIGFGGAFTEAAALNWKLLSEDDQKKVISLYFDPPEKGGHGYTLGRVPINSCDFSPESYSFDDVAGDVELEHFDTSVRHDVESGMIPMILAAQEKVVARGEKLNVYASP